MKRPCIQGLKRFENSGCPEKPWDGKTGCPAWKELIVAKRENPLEKELIKECIFEWYFRFQWAMLGLLEGNQQATESFRNGMIDETGHPKPDPAVVELLNLFKKLEEKQRIIFEYEAQKKLSD